MGYQPDREKNKLINPSQSVQFNPKGVDGEAPYLQPRNYGEFLSMCMSIIKTPDL